MGITLLKFFIHPSASTLELLKIKKEQKSILITGELLILVLVLCCNPINGFSFSIKLISAYLVFPSFVFIIGKLFKVKWHILDVFLFSFLSYMFFGVFYILGFFLGFPYHMYMVGVGLICTFRFMVKSLSKVGNINDIAVAGILGIAYIIIKIIAYYV